ncbi:Mucosa-associated lymphoid tissue lymphoma translocation protein 1 -like protein [Trichinella zimbabwensis]|uniref:Mucosa-associated lymphoid tissue lymphoma translocation protein 1-like protein n=1 Tax=Trichinella zimbabwensis TaxID=268475 RepID=A0A0V1HBE0_9BILA|nr:Mucosa-associated lymphoid tissue lymphoma translocation protein 1 -like protein [Trichinella zimbabwensis]
MNSSFSGNKNFSCDSCMDYKFSSKTTLADIPWLTAKHLTSSLATNSKWRQLVNHIPLENMTSSDVIQSLQQSCSPAEALLRFLGKRQTTVADMLNYCHEAHLLEPQLILHRKFKHVKIVEQLHLVVENSSMSNRILACAATGFPYPEYHWYCDGHRIDTDESNCTLCIDNKSLSQGAWYYCIVTNEVKRSDIWDEFYFKDDKQYKSALQTISIHVDSTGFKFEEKDDDEQGEEEEDEGGEANSQNSSVYSKDESVSDISDLKSKDIVASGNIDLESRLFAVDKVALIICNSKYENIPTLLTPFQDGSTLAECLIQLGFKTVTLSDLTLSEMHFMIKEYCQLLGSGVYAVLYFVGHGFEVGGQCYLLPTDVKSHMVSFTECLCTEEILTMMQEMDPAVSVIFLDICRRQENFEIPEKDFKRYTPRVKRNCIIGYATSFGEGAYEIVGESNGVFMKYLKKYVKLEKPIAEVLTLVMQDLEMDDRARKFQFPEIRTNLSKSRSLADPLIYTGHTETFDLRTCRWQQIHQLPEPLQVVFETFGVYIMIWFDFYAFFSNLVLVYASVFSLCSSNPDYSEEYSTNLIFPEILKPISSVVELGRRKRLTLKTQLNHLQKLKQPLAIDVELIYNNTGEIMGRRTVTVGDILISSLQHHTSLT